MKRIFLVEVFLLCITFVMAQVPFQKSEMTSIMKKVADWKIANGLNERHQIRGLGFL